MCSRSAERSSSSSRSKIGASAEAVTARKASARAIVLGDACDDDRAGGREAAHERRAQRPAAHERQPAASERSAGGRARSTALCALPDRDQRLDGALLDLPEGRLARDAEQDEEAEMDLTRDQRRQLDHQRARAGGAIEVVRRRLDGLSAGLGERVDGDPRVGRVELALRRRAPRRRSRRRPGRQAIGRVGGAGAGERALRGSMGGLQEPWTGALRRARSARCAASRRAEPPADAGTTSCGRLSARSAASLRARDAISVGSSGVRSSLRSFHCLGHDPFPVRAAAVSCRPAADLEAADLTRLPRERTLDCRDDPFGLVPLLVDAHADRRALLGVLADEERRSPRAAARG